MVGNEGLRRQVCIIQLRSPRRVLQHQRRHKVVAIQPRHGGDLSEKINPVFRLGGGVNAVIHDHVVPQVEVAGAPAIIIRSGFVIPDGGNCLRLAFPEA